MTHLDGVCPVFLGKFVQQIQCHLQSLPSELSKLPGSAVVAVSTAHPDAALVAQHILCQLTGVGVVAGILWREGRKGGREGGREGG